MSIMRYTAQVPLYLYNVLMYVGFDTIPTYAEVLDWLLSKDMWLEARYFGINNEDYEFKDMRDEMHPHRICCGGDVKALDIVIEEAVNYVIEHQR